MSGTVAELVAGLPSNLAERSRLLSSRAPSREGEFVLYWMHHAVRAHENPALDAAIELANRIGVPVLVYQGLSGAHRYNNDRHQTFILEGAREAHRELRALGIRSVFFLNKGGQEASPLHALARRAAILVVEDFPAPPFVRWSANLVSKNLCPAIAVDSACIVPMQAQPKRFERAFEFRRHNQSAFASRIQRQWPVVCPTQPIFDGEIGFDALDLASMDVAETCAACAIDHSVPPIPGTPGGAAAGYRRWRAFLRQGLSGYACDRNDAAIEWPRGVSRMSPYLHHGHVSPFRIAREAAATENEGCSKFLDEMLVWRELAFNFCFFTQEPERIDALPAWARTTLLDHADDARKRLVDNDSLARSGSNDELWDLAQASLRIHGELHNNLRMTWAKAIPYWRPDPQSALETMIELNHRYALDGSDPNSYGGLLWSLGLFDRPFERKPVMGTVRARSTEAHARRLNLDLYRARVRQPATGKAIRIAVIGAGLSGLSAARVLHDQGHQVQIFEKSRGLGGRAATRRGDGVSFDHGAQYFTARDPAFRRVVEAWCERGVVERWPARMGRVRGGRIQSSPDEQQRFVAVPGMSALGGLLGADLDIRRQMRVEPPKRVGSRWMLVQRQGRAAGRL